MTSIHTLVADRRIVTVEPQSSVRDAAKLMATHSIGALPVLDSHRLVGIITERDLMVQVIAADRDPSTTAVSEVMTHDLVVARPEESYETCLGRMQHARVRHLIVLDGDRLAGILSLRDLLAVDVSEKSEAINLLTAYVTG